jgi:hypothetical protein
VGILFLSKHQLNHSCGLASPISSGGDLFVQVLQIIFAGSCTSVLLVQHSSGLSSLFSLSYLLQIDLLVLGFSASVLFAVSNSLVLFI